MGGKTALLAGIVVLVVLAAIGAWFTAKRYSPTTPWEERAVFPWGIMVPSYVFFASSGAGVAIIASILLLYRPSDDAVVRLVRHLYILVFGLLIPAWYIVLADLGRPDHAVWLLKGWQSSSRIAWMPVFYGVLALPAFLILVHNTFFTRREFTFADKVLAIITILGGIGLEINLGQVFGNAVGLQAITSPNLGLMFLVAAIGLGAAWMAVIVLPTIRFAEAPETRTKQEPFVTNMPAAIVAAVAVVLGIAVAWWKSMSAVSEPTRLLFEELSSGHHAAIFYGVEILLGYILAPLIAVTALLRRGDKLLTLLASTFFILAAFAEKYGIIIGAQIVRAKYQYLGAALNPYYIVHEGASYHVELSEAAIVIGAFALGLLVYVVAEALLPRFLQK
ncbi:polysulfide reductase NrfD [Pyrofollis japonicus]|uniref:NrfD/PsrC family molybdoenzyme membrane anchor subunit n=1 Tax=Pyrofollis japonicus TaxID=3060460 RepID=UPI00295A600D|nr:NrfD/PsrC family molybdoenzyme membrane anchor subunit [Pyrofollis japonicus]BEP18639.1 polysulfide reductase NrfD [Pyrofollis japonicus]